MNWSIGWWLILAGFLSGAVMGLFFHREEFLGGYGSFQRRLLRLGHIACAALGMLNLIVGLSPVASPWLAVGSVTMPVVCFLTAWRKPCRHLFCVPVVSLVVGVVLMLINPNVEIRNPRQARSTNGQISEATSRPGFPELPSFGFVSDFDIRVSDLTRGLQ